MAHDITIVDDRTPDEVATTQGFWVATDRFLGGWGRATGRSLVACPCRTPEDAARVRRVFESRPEFLRVRWISGPVYRPRLSPGDHLHIYNTTHSFRYALDGDH
jgi:hypothetical protein